VNPIDGAFSVTELSEIKDGWVFTIHSTVESFVLLFPFKETDQKPIAEKEGQDWRRDIGSCIEDQQIRLETLVLQRAPSVLSNENLQAKDFETKRASTSKLSFLTPKSENRNSPMRIAPIWKPSQSAISCACCTTPFSLTRRRHHCRICGEVVCDHCSKNRIFINRSSISYTTPSTLNDSSTQEPQRVCDVCAQKENKGQKQDTINTPLLKTDGDKSCGPCIIM